jgi:hypothetical protein
MSEPMNAKPNRSASAAMSGFQISRVGVVVIQLRDLDEKDLKGGQRQQQRTERQSYLDLAPVSG